MASIAEKSRTKEIIDRFQTIINGASAVPLAPGKISVFKDEIQSLLDELAAIMENELKTYHEVNDRRGKIISEAKKEAERIIYQAEHSASRMRVSKTTTNVSPIQYESLNEEERSALGNANEIYGASLIYTDEMMTAVSEVISTAYNNIRSDYEIVLNVLEEKMQTLDDNRAELMQSLQEMDGPERSQQILEIGQLLSNELHMSRMKAKMDSDEYDDGSVQLSLNLAEQAEEKTRQAEEKAALAEQALAQVKAERDALEAEVKKMIQEGLNSNRRKMPSFVKMEESQGTVATPEEKKENSTNADETKAVSNEQTDASTESAQEEEYEIVYVTEDELEEGEEYEIEYVDEEEYEEYEEQVARQHVGESKVDSDVKQEPEEAVPEAVEVENDLDMEIPLIPHFKVPETVATVPSEKIAKMAKAISTEEKYSGLIGRAVKQKEKALQEAAVTVEAGDVNLPIKKKTPEEVKKTDADNKEYVQATMKFDEDYEILEF